MSNTSEDNRIKDDTLFYLDECVKEFGKLRLSRDKSKQVFSPSLTGISTSSCFYELIYLCSEHDPTTLQPVLRNALEKCTEAEKRMNEERESRKREAELLLGSETHKKAKLQHLGKATATISQQSQPMPISSSVPEIHLPLVSSKSGVTANLDSQTESQETTTQVALAVMVPAAPSSRCQSPEDMYGTGPILSPALHLARPSEDGDSMCDKRSKVADIQNWTGSECGLDSGEDMEYESDIHGEDSTVQESSAETEIHDCDLITELSSMSPDTEINGSELFVPKFVVDANESMKATLEPSSIPRPLQSSVVTESNGSELFLPNPVVDANESMEATLEPSSMPHPLQSSVATESNGSELFLPYPVIDANESMKARLEPSGMPNPLQSSVATSLTSQESQLTNNSTKNETPTTYDVELGLVRGEETIKQYVIKQCFPLSGDLRPNKKRFSKGDDLRELFPIFRRLPFRIVKNKLLCELENRIEVPGQKTAIPSTADLFNPRDILDALQSIKMTTINAKINRAYGQMRLYKAVQGKIGGVNYKPDTALKHGVAAHTSILAMMACCSAGKVSEKEQKDRINSFKYEYDAGRKWLDVAEWFGGEAIVLIFATAGVWNQSPFFLRTSLNNAKL